MPLLLLILNGVGWIFSYYLIYSHQAEQNDAQTELLKIQAENLRSIEQKLSEEIALLRGGVQLFSDINAVRNALRPNIILGNIAVEYNINEINMQHAIKNAGSNLVTIEAPTIQISLSPEFRNDVFINPLRENHDFSFDPMRPGARHIGSSGQVRYALKIVSPRLRKIPLYYRLEWKMETDSGAVKVANELLRGTISTDELREISRVRAGIYGSLRLP